MWKINIPFMRRYIRTFSEIAEVAEIALIYNLSIVGNVDPIHFHGFAFIHQIKQSGKGITKADAAATTMTDVIDPL